MSSEHKLTDNISLLVLNILPLAFGVVLVVLSLLSTLGVGDPLQIDTVLPLIGLALICLGLIGVTNQTQN